MIQYFVYQKEADGLEKEDWKSLNFGGYKLFREGHVQKIYVSSSGSVSVKANLFARDEKGLNLFIRTSHYSKYGD